MNEIDIDLEISRMEQKISGSIRGIFMNILTGAVCIKDTPEGGVAFLRLCKSV